MEVRRVTQVAGTAWGVKRQGEKGAAYRQEDKAQERKPDSRHLTAKPRLLAFTLWALGSHGRLQVKRQL